MIKNSKKLTEKDGLLKERVIRTLQEISINPEIENLNVMHSKRLRSVHIAPFVIIYAIVREDVLLINFDEYDKAYDTTAATIRDAATIKM